MLLLQQIKEPSLMICALFKSAYYEMIADVYLKVRFAQSHASKTISHSVWIMITESYALTVKIIRLLLRYLEKDL